MRQQIDVLLSEPLERLEPLLQWALAEVEDGVDWVRLIDDLSIWEREAIRRKWAYEFLGDNEHNLEGAK